jgi:hypothetical protein
MSSYNRMTEKLADMVQDEHCEGCCEDHCDITACYDWGATLWAIELFASCGAASNEFDRIYGRLMQAYGSRFRRAAERERAAFCASVETLHCKQCGAYTYLGDHNRDYYEQADAECGSCLAPLTLAVEGVGDAQAVE